MYCSAVPVEPFLECSGLFCEKLQTQGGGKKIKNVLVQNKYCVLSV